MNIPGIYRKIFPASLSPFKTLLRWILILGLITTTWWIFCLPGNLFKQPLATELLDANGQLLSARIAQDGQWRMPAADSISSRLKTCVLTYEDRQFYQHWGVSLRAIARAMSANIAAGRVVEGGSTISMQVARMARGNQTRNLWQKILEAAWASRLEWRYSKDEILHLWLNNAPFGGNAVGIEAASRRYYGRSPKELSWAEAATLAVLPNSPGLIHPGRDREALRIRRDKLLDRLFSLGHISNMEADLAKQESLPGAPLALPRHAPHLLERLRTWKGEGRYHSSIQGELQLPINKMVREYQSSLAGNQIHNIAVMVSEVATGRVLVYIGNTPDVEAQHAPAVDIIQAPRSPGSLLKPIIYALSLEEGLILNRQLLRDTPTRFNDFTPQNFHKDFDGAVPADEALARSLNIPFVHLLQQYGVARLQDNLHMYGFNQMPEKPEHYGLSMALGGAEITMEEIHRWFLGMARQLRYFHVRQSQYSRKDFDALSFEADSAPDILTSLEHTAGPIGAGATYLTMQALREVSRPDESGAYRRFAAHKPVAWKTGTSFGYRDAWAVGCTPSHVVSVWVGNANGEGRPGLVGVRAAAPLLFQIIRSLPFEDKAPQWFDIPYDDLLELKTCKESGLLAGPDCPARTEWVAAHGERGKVCNYHQRIFVSSDEMYRVSRDCGFPDAHSVNWFLLPARQAYYYQKNHSDYRSMPPFHPNCQTGSPANAVMQIIYPYQGGILQADKGWDGKRQAIVFEATHQDASATIHWHLDDDYLESTQVFHHIEVNASAGKHLLSLVDDQGNRLLRYIEIK